MQIAAEQASDLLKTPASRYRLMIICQLIDADARSAKLAAFLGIRDSTMSCC